MVTWGSSSQRPNKLNDEWGYDAVDLTNSFVLSWEISGDELIFRLECSLWPTHTLYEEPLKNRHTCYKAGVLKYSSVSTVKGLRDIAECKTVPAVDESATEDYGCIDNFDQRSNGVWLLEGEFGEIEVTSDNPILEIRGKQL